MTKVVNKNKEPFDCYIGRGSLFGNPFIIGKDGSRDEVISKYESWIFDKINLDKNFKQEVLKLKNHTLGCFCRPENRCHGDIIQEYVDSYKALAIIGSRSFNDYNFLLHAANVLNVRENYSVIISGGARGADELGEQYAKYWGLEYIEFLPDWENIGKSAGYKRNVDIIKCADAVLAFWNGTSMGTRHSLNIAKEMKKPSFVFYF